MKIPKKNIRDIIIDILPLVVCIICIIAVSASCRNDYSKYIGKTFSLSEGWMAQDGEVYTLDDLPDGDIVGTHELAGMEIDDKCVCFKSTHTLFSVSFDGEETYRYEPVQKKLLGVSYGMYVHAVPIPDSAKSVTLSLNPLYKGSADIDNAVIEDGAQFIERLYRIGLISFSLSVLIFCFGVLMLFVGIPTINSSEYSSINFFALGAFAILVGVWTTNETMILQMWTGHPEIIRFVNYMSLIFIAYPPLSFMASATSQRKTKFLPVLLILTFTNLVFTLTLSALGVCDIRSMLTFSHINIGISLIGVIFLLIRAKVSETAEKKLLRTVVFGITPAAIGVAMDLVRFRIFSALHFDASLFTKLGVSLFIGIMGLHLVHERTNLALAHEKSMIMQQMAYTDSLTGLSNRTAFHEKEEEIRLKRSECIIVQLDINFLKSVNDIYGHSEGDRHIIGAANIIHDSFENVGTAYRTGGDEFIVVVQGESKDENESEEDVLKDKVTSALKQLDLKVKDYNLHNGPPVEMQIAYGFAHCPKWTDMLEEAEKEADKLMYDRKKRMKENEELPEGARKD